MAKPIRPKFLISAVTNRARRARLDEARVWLDALRTALVRGDGGGPAHDGSQGELADGAADGTISRPSPDGRTRMDSAPPLPLVPAPLVGRQAGTPWSSEYAEVVARWVELSRAAEDAR